MADAIASVADRFRGERRDMERRMSDGRRRRLREKLDTTNEELEREREARRALAEVLEKIEGRRRSRGFLRLLIIGGGAYLLGSRAGRERYEAIMSKAGELRGSLMEQMQGARSRAMDTAQRVPAAVSGAAQSIKGDLGDTAQRVGEDVGQGASAVGEDVSRSASGMRTGPGSTGPSGGSMGSSGSSSSQGAGTGAASIGHTPGPSTEPPTRSEDV
jgi:hypothetical protein